MIDGIGHDTVSGFLNYSRIVLLTLSVNGNPRTGRDDGSHPEVRNKDI